MPGPRNRAHRILLPIAACAAIGSFACDPPASEGDGENVAQSTPGDPSHDQRTRFRAEMERAIDELEERVREARAKATADGRRLVDDVEERIPKLREELADLGDATQAGWQAFKVKIRGSIDELRRRLDGAVR